MLNDIAQKLNSAVSGANAQVLNAEDAKCDSAILVDASKIHAVAAWLKSSGTMNALQVISGVDYVEYLEVVYVFAKYDQGAGAQLLLKARLTDRVNPNLDSITDLFPAANFQERECYDMLGVTFNNHPDHRRILCPDDWQGFPLRRDYVAQKTYNGMEVFPESKMNMADREFIVRQEMIKKAQESAAGKVH
ncbi:MAG: NADH-quinone oxidoreductase subunit C [Bacteriovoracia bacterium]